jgi:hypothetical protein
MRETKNLFIRKFRKNGFHDIQRILGDSAVMFYSGCPPFLVEQSKEWLLNHISHYSELNSLRVFALEQKHSRVVIPGMSPRNLGRHAGCALYSGHEAR